MDSALGQLVSLAKFLYNQSQKVSQNGEECKSLLVHVKMLHGVIKGQVGDVVPADLVKRLEELNGVFRNICDMLEELSRQPYLKRFVWNSRISKRIEGAYKRIHRTVELGNQIDLRRFQQENHAARASDAAILAQMMDHALRNDQDIIELLQVKSSEMQDAMLALHERIAQLPEVLERRFLERGLYELQARSGIVRSDMGDSLIASFDVIITDRCLGAGGFGKVYEGNWRGTRVAVKVLNASVPEQLVVQEMRLWKRLRHPNILQFHGASLLSSPPFFVCDYKANGDARSYLRKYPDANRVKVLYEASLGLAYLHKSSVIHRDLKAANILIDKAHVACLSDFGLSEIKANTTLHSGVTGESGVHGTAHWMAPEQLKDNIVNKKTDIYSFAMTMYEIFAGTTPFGSIPETILYSAVVTDHSRPLRASIGGGTGLDDDVWDLMEISWHKHPSLRPHAKGISEALFRSLDHQVSAGWLLSPDISGTESSTALPTPQVTSRSAKPSKLASQKPPPRKDTAPPLGPPVRRAQDSPTPVLESPPPPHQSRKGPASPQGANKTAAHLTSDRIPASVTTELLPSSSTKQTASTMSEKPATVRTLARLTETSQSTPKLKASDAIFQWVLDSVDSWSKSELEDALRSCKNKDTATAPIAVDLVVYRYFRSYINYREQRDIYPHRYFVLSPSATARINECATNGDVDEGAKILRELYSVLGQDSIPIAMFVVGNRWKLAEEWVLHSFALTDTSDKRLVAYIPTLKLNHPSIDGEMWWKIIYKTWPKLQNVSQVYWSNSFKHGTTEYAILFQPELMRTHQKIWPILTVLWNLLWDRSPAERLLKSRDMKKDDQQFSDIMQAVRGARLEVEDMISRKQGGRLKYNDETPSLLRSFANYISKPLTR